MKPNFSPPDRWIHAFVYGTYKLVNKSEPWKGTHRLSIAYKWLGMVHTKSVLVWIKLSGYGIYAKVNQLLQF
jgi:hypothetical protein